MMKPSPLVHIQFEAVFLGANGVNLVSRSRAYYQSDDYVPNPTQTLLSVSLNDTTTRFKDSKNEKRNTYR